MVREIGRYFTGDISKMVIQSITDNIWFGVIKQSGDFSFVVFAPWPKFMNCTPEAFGIILIPIYITPNVISFQSVSHFITVSSGTFLELTVICTGTLSI